MVRLGVGLLGVAFEFPVSVQLRLQHRLHHHSVVATLEREGVVGDDVQTHADAPNVRNQRIVRLVGQKLGREVWHGAAVVGAQSVAIEADREGEISQLGEVVVVNKNL